LNIIYSLLFRYYIGEQARAARGILDLRSPIIRGEVVSWEDLERLWHFVFYTQLRKSPEDHPVFLRKTVFISHNIF